MEVCIFDTNAMKISPNIANLLIDIIPDMCFVLTEEHTVLSYNKRARDLLSLPETPPAEMPFFSLLDPASSQPVLEVSETSATSPMAEVKMQSRNGGVMDAQLFVSKIKGSGRDFLYVVARDITEAKQKELDLLRYYNVVHYTVNPIQITDKKGRMIYVNPAFERATMYTREDLLGRNPSILSSGKYSREFWLKAWARINAGEVWSGEIENRRKDGKPLYTQLLISPIVDANDEVVGFMGAHRDITKQKQLEQQLMHSQKMESIGTLAAGIAHEVGNPLASISSIVQVLMRTLTEEFAKEKLQLVQSQIHRITKIIRDLVDFSRPSNYLLQPTDVVRCVTDSVEIVKMAKKAKQVTFVTHIKERIPLLSLVPDQVAQVFINMLINAVDAMAEKEGKVEVTVDRDDEFVTVTIADDGSGISEANLKRVFEPFFTTKPVGEGTGLGLWVSYGIIKSFRGELHCDSTAGVGTTFTIKFPLNADEDQSIALG